MHLPSDNTLQRLCSTLELQFLESVIDSKSATETFADRLTELSFEEWSCPSTKAVAYSAATNLSILSTSFIDIESKSEEIERDLLLDIDGLLQRLTLGGPLHSIEAAEDTDAPVNRTVSRLHNIDTTSRFTRASRWLLAHLDNPYPSPLVKRTLCKESNLSMKTINDWFSQARRRIGWTSFLKRYFQGDRQLAIDCVHRILVECSGLQCFSHDIRQDVENMRATAHRLFSEKDGQIDLSKNFGGVVNGEARPTGRLCSATLKQPLHPTPTPIPTPPHDGFDSITLPSAVVSGLQSNASSQTSIKKKRSRDTSPREGQDYKPDDLTEVSRPQKRLKNLEAYETRAVSRSASFSTVSSRESTTELMTPPFASTNLPIASPFDAINNWVSGVVNGPSPQGHSKSSGTRKRRLPEPDVYDPVKRSCLEDSSVHGPGAIALEPVASPVTDCSCDIFSQFDFSLPPPAAYCSAFDIGESLQLDTFAYSNGFIEPSYDSRNDDGKLGVCPANLSTCLKNADDSLPLTNNETRYAPSASPKVQLDLCYDLVEGSSYFYSEGRDKNITEDTRASVSLSDLSLEVITASFPPPTALDSSDVSGTNHIMKLERINQLLAEAAKLQEEVFG